MTSETIDEILTRLGAFVSELKPAVALGGPSEMAALNMTEGAGLDSLDVINLLFRVEEEYGVKVPDEDIDAHELLVFGKLAAYVAERK